MIYLSLFFVATAIVILASWKKKEEVTTAKSHHASDDDDTPSPHGINVARKATLTFLWTLSGVCALMSGLTIVDSGHVGVEVVFGKVDLETYLSEGMHFKNPFAKIVEMSVRTETYTMSSTADEGQKKGDDAVEVICSDGLTLKIELSVPMSLLPSAAPLIYQKFGEKWQEALARPSIRSASREAFSQFSAQEAYGAKREEAKGLGLKKLVATITELCGKSGITKPAIDVQQMLVRDIQLPPTVKNSIEAKINAQQESEKMDFVIQKERKEAERKSVEATGIKNFQTIVSSGITPDLLKWKGIEATEKLAASENAKIVIIGDKNGLPLVLGDSK